MQENGWHQVGFWYVDILEKLLEAIMAFSVQYAPQRSMTTSPDHSAGDRRSGSPCAASGRSAKVRTVWFSCGLNELINARLTSLSCSVMIGEWRRGIIFNWSLAAYSRRSVSKIWFFEPFGLRGGTFYPRMLRGFGSSVRLVDGDADHSVGLRDN